jgi:2-isopropylmalate synthase
MGMPTATVRLRGPDGLLRIVAAIGTGPVDATYKAIDQVVEVPSTLLEFNIHAITEGIDAMGRVTVRIEEEAGPGTMDAQKETARRRTFGGYGADTDIIVAAAKAYLAALNKLLYARGAAAGNGV